jgi:hypothetical protein
MIKGAKFGAHSVAAGLHGGEFDELDTRTKKKLIRLMARIAEKSYRRGYQHGTLPTRTVDPSVLRFERSLDKSPWTDSPQSTSSVWRLFCECGELRQLGFVEPDVET